MGKKPPPKREMIRGCMDGWSNQDPPIMTYIQYIQKRMMRGRETEWALTVTAPMKKLIQDCKMVFLPLGRNDAQGTDETLPLCMERICHKEMFVSAT